jgi:hypothetical protein
MARIRSSKPEWWTSAKWCRLPRDLRATYKGIWEVMCDDEGRFLADPRQVKADVWPLDDDITPKKLAAWLPKIGAVAVTLDDGARSQAIVFYDVEGVRYGYVAGFVKHQKISHKTPSKLPPPPEPRRKRSGTAPETLPPDVDVDREMDVEVEKEKETTTTDNGAREAEPEQPKAAPGVVDLVALFPREFYGDIQSFLAPMVPARKQAWVANLLAKLNGMHPPKIEPQVAGAAIRQMLANGETNWKRFEGYCRMESGGPPPAKSNGSKIEPAIELAAGKQLE